MPSRLTVVKAPPGQGVGAPSQQSEQTIAADELRRSAGDPIEHISCKRRILRITHSVTNVNLVCKR